MRQALDKTLRTQLESTVLAAREVVETACRVNAPAEWVKGMGLLIGHLEKAPEECRMKFEKQ